MVPEHCALKLLLSCLAVQDRGQSRGRGRGQGRTRGAVLEVVRTRVRRLQLRLVQITEPTNSSKYTVQQKTRVRNSLDIGFVLTIYWTEMFFAVPLLNIYKQWCFVTVVSS